MQEHCEATGRPRAVMEICRDLDGSWTPQQETVTEKGCFDGDGLFRAVFFFNKNSLANSFFKLKEDLNT